MIIADKDGFIQFLNNPAKKIIGEKENHNISNLLDFKKYIKTQKEIELYDIHMQKHNIVAQTIPFQWDNQDLYLIVLYDITEITKAKQKIKDLALFPAQNPNPVLRISKKGEILYTNPVSKKLYEKHLKQTGIPPVLKKTFLKTIETEKKQTVIYKIGEKTFSFVCTPIKNEEYINIYGYDISKLINTENKLKQQLKYEKMIAEISSLGLSAKDINTFLFKSFKIIGKILNLQKITIFKYLYQKSTFIKILHWEHPKYSNKENENNNVNYKIFTPWINILKKNKPIIFSNINEISIPDIKSYYQKLNVQSILILSVFIKNTFWGFISFSNCVKQRNIAKECLNILKTFINIISQTIQQWQIKEELINEKEKLATILKSIGDGIIIIDATKKITFMNKSAGLIIGYTIKEVINKPIDSIFKIKQDTTSLIHKNFSLQNGLIDIDKIIKQIILTKNSITKESLNLFCKNNKMINISLTASPILENENITGIVIVFKDITEAKRYENELHRLSKFNAVKTLASGIAHDFNNLLTSILNNLSLIEMQTKSNKEISPVIKETHTILSSAINLAKQLLTFTTGGYPIKETVSLKNFLAETVKFFFTWFKYKMQISY